MKDLGVYIHIPFCRKKCDYCDFVSFNKNEEIQKKYLEGLIKNIENDCNAYNLKKYKINTIYIGGGTPSYIDSKYIVSILDKIREKVYISQKPEITIEVNPGTITEGKLLDYKKAGINRLSIGCQATQNHLLKMLGRIHNYEDFVNTYELAKKTGFENINVDLMIGLPNQTIKDVEESLERIISLNPQHVSVYSLIVETGTVLAEKLSNKELVLPEESLEREMYYKVKKILENNGFIHYEISNFAKKGFESKHNLNCWEQKEYIGFGLASHSYLNDKRFSNVESLDEYINNIDSGKFSRNIIMHEMQKDEDKRKEFMLLGLRKIEGVSIYDFEQKFRINPLFYFRFEIAKLEKEGLLEVDLDNIRLTKKGLDLANIVWEEFV